MAVTENTEFLPTWDLSPIFSGIDSKDFEDAFAYVGEEIDELMVLFDKHQVGVTDGTLPPGAAFDEILRGISGLSDRIEIVYAFIYGLVSTDARDAKAQAKLSELQDYLVELSKLSSRLTAWLGSFQPEQILEASAEARASEFFVRRVGLEARHQMSLQEEDLAASLSPTGASAWSKLHSDVTSTLLVEVEVQEGLQQLPMSAVRALAYDSDEQKRRSAYQAELQAWETVEVPLAAALNSVKGAGNVLNFRRRWASSIESSLFLNNVDAPTLEAMQQAVVESFPDFRRYLKAKARMLGKSSLPWWDLMAPLGSHGEEWTYASAKDYILDSFATFSPRLAQLAKTSFENDWIDVGPRDGKRDGAYCIHVGKGDSRVMMNFEPSFNSVQTLAHELGHAYHNLNLASRSYIQRETPMALAETASTFCQSVVFSAALEEASGEQKLALLEDSLQDASQVVVDIHSRFLFERAVFEARQKREQSADELKQLMLWAQDETYGEALDPDARHPYMWAVKGHYYIPGLSYYNWPYTFGMLFAFGLYARFTQDREGFPAVYDELLSSTGLGDAATLTSRFGIDIHSVDFWRASLDISRSQIDEFERLIP